MSSCLSEAVSPEHCDSRVRPSAQWALEQMPGGGEGTGPRHLGRPVRSLLRPAAACAPPRPPPGPGAELLTFFFFFRITFTPSTETMMLTFFFLMFLALNSYCGREGTEKHSQSRAPAGLLLPTGTTGSCGLGAPGRVGGRQLGHPGWEQRLCTAIGLTAQPSAGPQKGPGVPNDNVKAEPTGKTSSGVQNRPWAVTLAAVVLETQRSAPHAVAPSPLNRGVLGCSLVSSHTLLLPPQQRSGSAHGAETSANTVPPFQPQAQQADARKPGPDPARGSRRISQPPASAAKTSFLGLSLRHLGLPVTPHLTDPKHH